MHCRHVFLLSALACSLWADFLPSAWQNRKRLPVTAGAPVTSVHIDRQVYARAQPDLGDIRIIHGTEEVPFMLSRLSGASELKHIPAEILDRGATADSVQFVLALPKAARHSQITIETPESNFKRRVTVESAESAKGPWAVIRKEAYIFDFTYESQHSSILTIEYPASTRAFLRVTVNGWTDPKTVTGAVVSLSEERPPVREVMQEFGRLTPSEDAKSKATVYQIDFGVTGIPKDLLRFEVEGDGMFHRALEVETSDDPAKGWSFHARGVIYRTGEQQSFWIPIGDTRSRHLRIRLFHGDDKPLPVRSIVAEALLRRAIFPVNASGGDYWLYYGNPQAKNPSYDLPMVLARSSVDSAATVNAGAEEANPGYVPPPPPVVPFSDRHPEALYAVLGIAVLALGFLTVRFMQKASAASTETKN
jgi:hypothetical protein